MPATCSHSKSLATNAVAVAGYLAKHPKVSKVIFPGLMTGESKRRADAYLKGGYGALLGFELKSGKEAGRKFIDGLRMLYTLTLVMPAHSRTSVYTTHSHCHRKSSFKPASRRDTSDADGIEHPDDIIADIDQALAVV